MAKRKRTNNDLQKNIHKTKDRVTQTLLITFSRKIVRSNDLTVFGSKKTRGPQQDLPLPEGSES
jgi:hypothetical protein